MNTTASTSARLIAVLFAATLAAGAETVPAPFRPEWDSLKAHRDPEWFRDAKFGIYTHWGPVTVGCEDSPRGGQWYGKEMYEPGNPVFAYHKEKYGDQRTVGYKDMIPKFTAEKFDPEKWADLFAKAGAKFAGPVAVHHDNFAMWDSAVTPWNSAKMGPRRDVTGELAKAIRARGLKFVPTFHHGFAWRYFEPAQAYDAADGKNVLLYTEPHDPKDPPSARFLDQWLGMVMEVVRKYEPDMIWFDFELAKVITPEYQRRMFADYYNWAAEHGRESAVAHKHREIHQHTGILDFERGREDKLVPYPWLTDTALGPWFNQKSHPYRTTDNLIHVLADIVSKNGCMLLNVGPAADGSIPPEAERMLLELGAWLRVNGEAVYATRPWEVFGEGPTRAGRGGGFSEQADRDFTPRDIRFTRSKDGATLYAITLGVPDAPVRIRSLAAAAGRVTGVTLLGSDAKLSWTQDAAALTVELPAVKPCGHALALRIAGEGLKPVPVEVEESISAGADGVVRLSPGDATLHGDRIRVEAQDAREYIAAWDNPKENVSWKITLPRPGSYRVRIEYSSALREVGLQAALGDRTAGGTTEKTSGWYDYKTLDAGVIEVPAAGKHTLTLSPRDPAAWKAVNIRSVLLEPSADAPVKTTPQ